MAQWLGAVVLAEDPGSTPNTHRSSQLPVTPASWNLMDLFWSPWAPGTHI